MKYRVVIPARFASARLPGKPLLQVGTAPMVRRVVEQASRSRASSIVVATDDRRVLAAVAESGALSMLTKRDHPSGSDRVMEVVERAGWGDEEVVVNVQGDEPLIPPAVIDQVAELVLRSSDWRPGPCRVATLWEPIVDPADVFNPNVVKVVIDQRGRALYFSRAPLPWARETFASHAAKGVAPGTAARAVMECDPPTLAGPWRRHVGIYAYRVDALREFVAWPVGDLERVEALEQLRLLEHGRGIAVAKAVAPVPGGVDTPEDLARVRATPVLRPG